MKQALGLLLALSFTNSFAMNSECPSTSTIRDAGSKFLYAYSISSSNDNTWALLSEPFNELDVNWQTIYTVNLPYSIDNPQDAIRVGENLFKRSPLIETPVSTTIGEKKECLYTTADVNYKVTTVSPPPFGIKKAAK